MEYKEKSIIFKKLFENLQEKKRMPEMRVIDEDDRWKPQIIMNTDKY
jgi:hypothetical protein